MLCPEKMVVKLKFCAKIDIATEMPSKGKGFETAGGMLSRKLKKLFCFACNRQEDIYFLPQLWNL